MGSRVKGAGFGQVAQLCALAFGCLALANCSSGSSKYSPRVIADGEPIPKGGGTYRVGQPYRVNGRIYYPSENTRYRAEGIASWYGPDFHGRLTANGEVYDMHSISAAHTTMPIPSYARVTNLKNGRSIIVRVNDRGPYAQNRIIDLSIGAAKALDFYGEGLARVRVEYVGRAPLEGSDDRMLLATLRTGSPAPAPAGVMVASSESFVPAMAEGGGRRAEGTPIPAGRPFSLGDKSTQEAATRAPLRQASASPAREAPATEVTSGNRVRTVTVRRFPEAPAPDEVVRPAKPDPAGRASAFAPVRGNAAVDLMSGRGLY